VSRNKVILSLDGVLIHLTWIFGKFVRYSFVLLGEQRHRENNWLAQEHNTMTLPKALTRTVHPEFKRLSISLQLSFDELKFSINKHVIPEQESRDCMYKPSMG